MKPPTSSGSGRGVERYKLSDFEFVCKLGRGAHSVVQKVVQQPTGSTYAMKVLAKENIVKYRLEDQLRREVEYQGKARHPNVVRMHYYFEDKHTVYCLLEYADQGTLFAYLQQYPSGLPEPRAAAFFADTARGIAYLHSHSIVHRDLKPENILLYTEALVAKIGDLGSCAKLTAEEPERLTYCGTREYMPPEIMLRKPHDKSADLWALGVLLYEMLLARPPFDEEAGRPRTEAPGTAELPPGAVSQGAADLIRSLLRVDRAARLPMARLLQHPWLTPPGAQPRREPRPTPAAVARPAEARADADRVGHDDPLLKTDVLGKTNADLYSRIREQMDQLNDSFATRVGQQQERRRERAEEARAFEVPSGAPQRLPAPAARPAPNDLSVTQASVHVSEPSDEEPELPRLPAKKPVPRIQTDTKVAVWELHDGRQPRRKDRRGEGVEEEEPSGGSSGRWLRAGSRDLETAFASWRLREDEDLLSNVQDASIALDELDRNMSLQLQGPAATSADLGSSSTRKSRGSEARRRHSREEPPRSSEARAAVPRRSEAAPPEEDVTWFAGTGSSIFDTAASVWGLVLSGMSSAIAVGSTGPANTNSGMARTSSS